MQTLSRRGTRDRSRRRWPWRRPGCRTRATFSSARVIFSASDFSTVAPPIDWLCRRLGLSRRSLQRRFEAYGTSYGACLTQVLMGQAKDLLARTDRPVGRIGLDLGYADAAHFTRAFRAWTGLPPTVWRRLASGLETGPPMGR